MNSAIARSADRFRPQHFGWSVQDRVATITLNRPERKNPLTFESYAELRDLFRDLVHVADIRAIVVTGAGGNFCSGGDVHEIIGPLVKMDMPDPLRFTRMTGDPCAGAGRPPLGGEPAPLWPDDEAVLRR